ncbi:MAG TPA: long-chain fatty acid--CoA ligase [Verrucomicrobiae bacterium]|nr:long-chain fatty acid--CoA ligase [Verrucomicrobiae bacterium]
MSERLGGSSPYAERPWLKHYPPHVKPDLEYPHIPVYRFLDKSAREFPQQTATVFYGARLTYLDLLEQVNKFSRVLTDLGVEKGQRVAVMLPNCPQALIAYYAVLKLGAVVVQTNPLYVERELEFQLKDSGARTLVILDLLYPRAAAVKSRTNLKNIIVTGLQEYMPAFKRPLYGLKMRREGKHIKFTAKQGIYRFADLMLDAAPFSPRVEAKADDLALLQYTGGTTGVAKGAMLSHHNLVANVLQVREWMLDAQPGKERMLCALPFFHVYGMTVAMNLAISMGAELILTPRFEIKDTLKLIHKHRPTFFPGAPTMYVAVNNYPELKKYNLSSIRSCISGSAPLPVEVQETFERLTGGKLVEGYGLTEASPVTHSNPLEGLRKVGSIGIPMPDTECKIVDPETWEEVPQGEIGELAVKGPQVMQGYWHRPEETSATLREGWLYTGDMAKMDADGFFSIVDRKKDVIIAGGFNIYPREIEEVLYGYPKVQEAAVLGVPDPYRGETVKAYIVLKPGEKADKEELVAYCKERLAAFKVPRIVEFKRELPKTIVGKVLKRQLLEETLKEDPGRK